MRECTVGQEGKSEDAVYEELMKEREKLAICGILVAIDAGHGSGPVWNPGSGRGIEGVDSSGNSYNEYDINWKIANKLINELNKVNIIFSFNTRDGITNVDFTTRINNIMKRGGRPADLVVSIHGDAGDVNKNGIAILYHSGTRKKDFNGNYSKEFAEYFMNIFLDKYPSVQIIAVSSEFYAKIPNLSILTGNSETNYPPAILIEIGFMKNPIEVDRLTNPIKQDELVKAIADSIVDYVVNKCGRQGSNLRRH